MSGSWVRGRCSSSLILPSWPKYELPTLQRAPWRIAPLPDAPSLCPVTCLWGYLAASSDWTSGQPFRLNGGSGIHLNRLRAQLLSFIKAAGPDSVPTGRNCRSLASSLNFF